MKTKLLYIYLVAFLVISPFSYAATNEENQNIVIPDTVQGINQEKVLALADSSYSKGFYSEAAKYYEQLLESKGPSYLLYYNLGNSNYKEGNIASAILNYERALRIKPNDEDASFNLKLCNSKIVDKIEPIREFIFLRWYHSLENLLSSNTWAVLSLLFFILFVLSLFAYFFTRKAGLRRTGFYVGIITVIFSFCSFIFARDRYNNTTIKEGILFSPTVVVKSSPDKSGTDLFVIHEGVKVVINNDLSGWYEIKLPDGNIGWIESSNIEII